MILQSKIQNNSSFRSRKTMLTGGCRSENHSGISLSSYRNHRKYSERNIKLERDYELFRGGYPDIFWQRQLTSSAKAECEVVSS